MPFSVSIGDAIACATLVKDVVKSLKSGAGSSLVYQELLAEFQILELSFLVLERSKLDDIPEIKPILCKTIGNCKQNIEQFLSKNQKFALHLRQGGSSSPFKDALRKVQWTLFRDEDVKDIRVKIQLHLSAINNLLSMSQNAMIHNLARYTAAQNQQLVTQQADFFENQRRTQGLLSESHETTLRLSANVENISSSVTAIQRRSLAIRQRRPGLLGPRVISMEDFEKTLATEEGLSSMGHTQAIPSEKGIEYAEPISDPSSPTSTRPKTSNVQDSAFDPSTSRSPVSLDTPTQKARRISSQIRILDKHWKYLGAWLRVVTYQENRCRNYLEYPSLTHDEQQTVLDIEFLSRAISARLKLAYGDFQGSNGLSVSLSIPRILEDGDEIDYKLRNAPFNEFQTFFRKGHYHATDVFGYGWTMFEHAIYYERLDVYRFLINEGAKVDASSYSNFYWYYGTVWSRGHYQSCEEMLQVMQGELYDDELWRIGFDLWKYESDLSPEGPIRHVSFLLLSLSRHGFVVDMNECLKGYLDGYVISLWGNYPKRVGKDREELLTALELFVQVGADPFKYCSNRWEESIEGTESTITVIAISLTCIALAYEVTGPWLKILLRYGHSPAKAFRKTIDLLFFHADSTGTRRILFPDYPKSQTLLEKIKDDFYQAFLDLGYDPPAILEIFDSTLAEDDMPYEWPTHASSTDFEPGVLARLKLCDSAEPVLVKRKGRRYEGD